MKEQKKQPELRFKGFTDDWEERKLSDLTESHNSGVYIPKDQYGEGTNIIGVGDIYDSDVVDGQRYRLAPVKDKRFILHTNDLLYGESSLVPEGIARVVSVSEAGAGTAFAWHTRRFKVNQVTLNSRFLGLELDYWLPARSHLMRSSTKTALTGITTQDFFNTQIVFPSKPEQEKIATLINSLDTAIALHQRKLDLLKEQKKGYLQKMFPKNGAKVPELRFAGFADDWEERKLGDLGSVAMNKRIFKEQTSDVGDIPFYKIGTFGGTPDAFISRDIFEEYKSKYQYPEVGDILISASGSIGRTVVYRGDDEYFQDSNIVWLKHDQQLDNSFLKQFYSIVKWQGLEGSTIKRLYNKNILETKITLPSPEEQAQLGSFFKQLDNTIALHQRKLELLKKQKKGFLQKMFV